MVSPTIPAAITNLLDNAFKYTPPDGKVTLHVEDHDTRVVIRVIDSGQGIAPEDLPRLTERFFRADKAHSRTIPGSGLGLSIVQGIAEFYGGELTIHSEGAGRGTSASLTLPTR